MKCIRYILALLALLFVVTACSDEVLSQEQTLPEGTPITLRFVAEVPKPCVATRGVDDVQSLTLMVFDEKHRYLYRAKAVLGAVVAQTGSEDLRPTGTGINAAVPAEKREITVTLLSSQKKRIVHFVGNYDFTDFPADYRLENMDEGELMPSLYQEEGKPGTYWQVFDFDNLQDNSFNNVEFRLLRNQARISVENKAANFTFNGFCVNNAPNKGTVAPFEKKSVVGSDIYNDPRAVYDDVLYLFPRDPYQSTVMAGYALAPKEKPTTGIITNKNPILVYEYRNTEADADKQLSLIVHGQLAGKSPAYYKIDLAQQLYDATGNYIGSKLYDIVRNFAYLVTIQSVEGAGYPTYEEAERHPAGNNIFASVELKHYGTVSNGKYALVVDNTDALMTLPGRFETYISFTDASQNTHPDRVRVYLNGKECVGAIDNDPHITYANYNKENGGFYVNIKAIPENEERQLDFTIIGTAPDGSHIQRNLMLQLHPRYHFNPVLTDDTPAYNPQGEKVGLTFTIPGTLHENLFPYSVYIAADYLSPYVDALTNDGLKIVRRGDRIFYEYVVSEKPAGGRDTQKTLYFKRTLTDYSSVVTLSSNFYLDADVLLPNTVSVNGSGKVPLYYTGLSYSEPRIFASKLRTTLRADVVSGSSSVPTVEMASAGYLKMTFANTAYGTSQIKLTATMHHAGGDIVCTKTMSKAEWIAALNNTSSDAGVVMDIDQIAIAGGMKLIDWRSNRALVDSRGPVDVPTNITNIQTSSTPDGVGGSIALTIPETGKYKLVVSGLSAVKQPVSYTLKFQAVINSATCTFTSNSLYLGGLLENPDIKISE